MACLKFGVSINNELFTGEQINEAPGFYFIKDIYTMKTFIIPKYSNMLFDNEIDRNIYLILKSKKKTKELSIIEVKKRYNLLKSKAEEAYMKAFNNHPEYFI